MTDDLPSDLPAFQPPAGAADPDRVLTAEDFPTVTWGYAIEHDDDWYPVHADRLGDPALRDELAAHVLRAFPETMGDDDRSTVVDELLAVGRAAQAGGADQAMVHWFVDDDITLRAVAHFTRGYTWTARRSFDETLTFLAQGQPHDRTPRETAVLDAPAGRVARARRLVDVPESGTSGRALVSEAVTYLLPVPGTQDALLVDLYCADLELAEVVAARFDDMLDSLTTWTVTA